MAKANKKGKYNTTVFDPEIHCASLIKTMSQGKSFGYWCGREMSMGRTKGYVWLKKYPVFREAFEIGYYKGLAFYEDLLMSSAMGIIPKNLKDRGSKSINVTAVIFTMKTRFHREYSEANDDLLDEDDELEFIGK